jgi:hypothetical protein
VRSRRPRSPADTRARPRRGVRRCRSGRAGGIERELWNDFHGRYLRSLADPTPDVSLLGLAWPFATVEPGGERMRATVAALEAELGFEAPAERAAPVRQLAAV